MDTRHAPRNILQYLLLALGGVVLLSAMLALASLKDASKQNVRALTPEDISTTINGIFNTGDASAITALAGPDGQILVGGTVRSGGSFVPKQVLQ